MTQLQTNLPEEIKNDPRVPAELNNNVFITTLDKIYNWGRKRSMWPMLFGLACCVAGTCCSPTGNGDTPALAAESGGVRSGKS